jgi:hypothetical protein
MSICPTTAKTKYKNEQEANKGLEKFKEKIPSYNGESYYCFYCGGYHFGRQDKKDKNK